MKYSQESYSLYHSFFMKTCPQIENRAPFQMEEGNKVSVLAIWKSLLWMKQGFTLIELLMVVTIIAIIGIASISGFSRMNQVQDSETSVKLISNTLDSLEHDILGHKMVSYDAVFESGSVGFTTNLDWYKKKPLLQYSFDFITGTGMIRSSGTGTWLIYLRLATYDTSGKAQQLSESGWTSIFSFPSGIQKRWYQILGNLDGRGLNSFIIQYYNLTNSTPENETHLIKIEGTIEWSSKQYNSLLVRNVLGRKFLKGSGTTMDELEKATLTFEKNGKEMPLVVTMDGVIYH